MTVERDPRVIALVNVLAELDQKRDAVMIELRAILGGSAGLGPRMDALKEHWCDLWTERHHEPIVFDSKKHGAELKKKMLAYGDDIVRAKMANYILCDDPFHVKERHPFRLFAATFDTWRGIPAEHLNGDHSAALTSEKMRGLRGE